MENEALDLRAYWQALLAWWWILLLGVVGASLGAYFVGKSTVPIYEAKTKMLVQGGRTLGSPSLSDIQLSRQLARNFSDLIRTRPVLEKVTQELSLPYGGDSLSNKIVVSNPSSLIVILVRDPNPELAAAIANTTAEIFINDSLDRNFAQIAQFQALLNQYGINQDSSIIAAQASTLGTLSIVEEALPPTSPSGPHVKRDVVIASVLGLILAVLLVFLIEFLNNKIKSPEDLKRLTGMQNLGSVALYSDSDSAGSIITEGGRRNHSFAEAYKFLRTNLEFASLGTHGPKVLLITSSIPGEGKTTTAANMAISLAQDGDSVILVDSDLRKPTIHKVFDVENEKGFTHLILGNSTLDEVLAQSPIENLQIIPSGVLPPDATHVLRSPRMTEVVDLLKKNADFVVFDSPPLLSVTDPMLLASLVDSIIMVLDAHNTRRNIVKRGAEVISQVQGAVVGTLLNKTTNKGRSYHYYYYDAYYEFDDSQDDTKQWRSFHTPAVLHRIIGRGKDIANLGKLKRK